ncbi:uroporphyrinogen-III C-methyltransferase [Lacipirellula limnantheis]|uniref:uroporphyrinogen-III C-methyltransferase n=1 Tax=Lacipirellula limnantheis TaxID=2528024 RepID=A0A517U143_9BACT|nr:uroporphyrinogen-III C-methyltransferase [Lacipirellula limnantheis]QDT74349.1 Uroporphyrinogen-III C-methyltransferase [Lacipirellula limnantheis]
MSQIAGTVYLIGAGPGDPGLLTLRGRQRLGQADVVIYDYLVNSRILQFARPNADLQCLGRHGQGRLVTQDEIHQRMIAAARAGKTVARLKGGDPAIFGRTTEELAALDAANIPYEVVPGITSAQAASAYAGIPLTHRDASSCVAFVTGQQCLDHERPLDMAGLAQFPGTLVFYMGVTSAPRWSAELIAHGKPRDTPVGIVRRASWPQQQTLVTTLGELATVLAPGKVRPPAVVIVGEAVAERAATDWFAMRPLAAKTILVTRPIEQSEGLVAALSDLGAAVLVQPAIEIGPPRDWTAADRAIQELPTFDWLVFSSANGVRYFLERLRHHHLDLRALGRSKIAAIGPGTADALAEFHLRADLLPVEYRAESLAESLAPLSGGRRVLLLRASRGREVLAELLAAAGADVEQAVVYESRDVAAPDPEIAAALRAGAIDWVTVTSSAIAKSLVAMFGADLSRTRLAAISPLTGGVLEAAGCTVATLAEPYTTAGVVDAILADSRR